MEQYGDLTEKEYLELLNEIEDEDSDIKTESDSIESVIAREDAEDSVTETENKTEDRAEPTKRYVSRRWRYSIEEVAKRRKDIQRAAFNQDKLSLSDEIPQIELTELIKILTKSLVMATRKYEGWINKRLARWLRPFIPMIIRNCYYKYPQSVIKCPGFLYKASEEYGEGEQIWATPNIPYYIPQGTELDLLKKHKPEMLYTIDKLVAGHNKYKRELRKRELKYAGILINKKINTYYALLKLNPFWFNKLYEYKFNEPLIVLKK